MDEKSGGLACLLYSIVLSNGFIKWDFSLKHIFYTIYNSLAKDRQDQAGSPLVEGVEKVDDTFLTKTNKFTSKVLK